MSSAALLTTPQNTIIKPGDSLTLTCSTDDSIKPVRWDVFLTPNASVQSPIFSGGAIKNPYPSVLYINFTAQRGRFDLVTKNHVTFAQTLLIGRYICTDGDGDGVVQGAEVIILGQDFDLMKSY